MAYLLYYQLIIKHGSKALAGDVLYCFINNLWIIDGISLELSNQNLDYETEKEQILPGRFVPSSLCKGHQWERYLLQIGRLYSLLYFIQYFGKEVLHTYRGLLYNDQPLPCLYPCLVPRYSESFLQGPVFRLYVGLQ